MQNVINYYLVTTLFIFLSNNIVQVHTRVNLVLMKRLEILRYKIVYKKIF